MAVVGASNGGDPGDEVRAGGGELNRGGGMMRADGGEAAGAFCGGHGTGAALAACGSLSW